MSTSKVQTREPLNTRQRSILIAFYNQNPYPSASERHQLVQLTGRTLKQIQDWFSNRRRTDPKLKSTLPPPPPMPIYYYPSSTICSCCCYTPVDQSSYYYPPPPTNIFHC